MTRTPRALLLIVIAAITLALSATSFSSSPLQGAGKVSTRDFPLLRINADDLSKLPGGDTRIIQTPDGGARQKDGQGDVILSGSSATQVPSGSVVFKIDGVERVVPLVKTGAGTLILPNISSTGHGASSSKMEPSRLILSDSPRIVYEWKHLGIFKFSQVFMPTGDNSDAGVIDIKTYLQQQRPEGAMKGWPFDRLLIGPAAGIAHVEGWKAGTSKGSPTAKYVCQSGKSCQCSGTADCLKLADSNACSSQMNCDGTGNNVKCYCSTK